MGAGVRDTAHRHFQIKPQIRSLNCTQNSLCSDRHWDIMKFFLWRRGGGWADVTSAHLPPPLQSSRSTALGKRQMPRELYISSRNFLPPPPYNLYLFGTEPPHPAILELKTGTIEGRATTTFLYHDFRVRSMLDRKYSKSAQMRHRWGIRKNCYRNSENFSLLPNDAFRWHSVSSSGITLYSMYLKMIPSVETRHA